MSLLESNGINAVPCNLEKKHIHCILINSNLGAISVYIRQVVMPVKYKKLVRDQADCNGFCSSVTRMLVYKIQKSQVQFHAVGGLEVKFYS